VVVVAELITHQAEGLEVQVVELVEITLQELLEEQEFQVKVLQEELQQLVVVLGVEELLL
jgi:hypothetical protein